MDDIDAVRGKERLYRKTENFLSLETIFFVDFFEASKDFSWSTASVSLASLDTPYPAMAITKKILAKAKARPSAATASTKKVSKPLPDESSDSESDAQDLQDQESAEEESGDSENEEEEDDVTEEALQRMMELLGDVDPEELALLEAEAAAESGSEGEEGQDQDDDEDEDDEDMYNLEDGSDAEEEGMYEDLQEEDTDITPVERTTVNDKVCFFSCYFGWK